MARRNRTEDGVHLPGSSSILVRCPACDAKRPMYPSWLARKGWTPGQPAEMLCRSCATKLNNPRRRP